MLVASSQPWARQTFVRLSGKLFHHQGCESTFIFAVPDPVSLNNSWSGFIGSFLTVVFNIIVFLSSYFWSLLWLKFLSRKSPNFQKNILKIFVFLIYVFYTSGTWSGYVGHSINADPDLQPCSPLWTSCKFQFCCFFSDSLFQDGRKKFFFADIEGRSPTQFFPIFFIQIYRCLFYSYITSCTCILSTREFRNPNR